MRKRVLAFVMATTIVGVTACGNTSATISTEISQEISSQTGKSSAENMTDAQESEGSDTTQNTLVASDESLAISTSYSKTGKSIELRLGHAQPTGSLTDKACNDFAALVNKETDGEITIQVYPDSTFGSNADMVTAIEGGDLDFFVTASAQFATQYEPISVVDAWYMFKDTDHLFKFYSPDCEAFQQLSDGLKDKVGVDTLASFYYGARQMTADTTINSVDDLRGLKMRVASDPMPTAFFKALGAVPTPVAYNETYLALQQKVADGEENPIASIRSMKFDEVQTNLALTYHQYQMFNFFLSMATEDKKLNDNQFAVIKECAQRVSDKANADSVNEENSMIEDEKSKLTVTSPDLEEFRTKCQSIYSQYENTWGAGIADNIQKIAE